VAAARFDRGLSLDHQTQEFPLKIRHATARNINEIPMNTKPITTDPSALKTVVTGLSAYGPVPPADQNTRGSTTAATPANRNNSPINSAETYPDLPPGSSGGRRACLPLSDM
jgi:hypothetical protein